MQVSTSLGHNLHLDILPAVLDMNLAAVPL